MEKNNNMKIASGIIAFFASVFLLVYVYQMSHGLLNAILYVGVTLLGFALATFIVGFISKNVAVKYLQVAYLVGGLAMIYSEVMLSGGKNTFLYLAIFTAFIAALMYVASSYGFGFTNPRKTGIRAH